MRRSSSLVTMYSYFFKKGFIIINYDDVVFFFVIERIITILTMCVELNPVLLSDIRTRSSSFASSKNYCIFMVYVIFNSATVPNMPSSLAWASLLLSSLLFCRLLLIGRNLSVSKSPFEHYNYLSFLFSLASQDLQIFQSFFCRLDAPTIHNYVTSYQSTDS